MTARWVVDAVSPERDLDITWKPISLFFKNEPPEDSDYYEPTFRTHRLLRVFMSVQSTDGNDAAFRFYWELGSRIHHDGDFDFPVEDALVSAGLDVDHAAAYDDDSWDDPIRDGMDDGLALTGQDVGTPIIAFADNAGERVGLFGPVITRVPDRDDALDLWDGFMKVARVPGFWELKRTRTVPPDFGDRPEAR
ncbi:MAG: disulfide bond formation protein DsbA [Actinomycetota bacterium]